MHSGRLDSWKDIAAYLGRDVRTAMRWEQYRGLPVRRVPGGQRNAVFAYRDEIDEWLKSKRGAEEGHTTSAHQGRRSWRGPLTVALICILLLAALGAVFLYRFIARDPPGSITGFRSQEQADLD